MKSKLLSNILGMKTVIFCIFTIILTFVNILGYNVFPYIMIGLAGLFNIPMLLVFLSTLFTTIVINFNVTAIVFYTIYFIVFAILYNTLQIEGISKKYIILIKVMFSLLVTTIIKSLVIDDYTAINLIYENLISVVIFIPLVYTFFVLLNLNKNYVFSEEEKLSCSVLIAFIISIFSGITYMDLSIVHILLLITVLIYSYKSGLIIGTTSSVILSLILMITCNLDTKYILVLIFASLISSLCKKLGKVSVFIVFIASMIILYYISDSYMNLNIMVIEIIVAFTVLFFMPKKAEKSLDNFFIYKDKLESPYKNLLAQNDMYNKINVISNLYQEMSEIKYIENAEDKNENREIIYKYVLNEIENNNLKVDENIIKISIDEICFVLENEEELDGELYADKLKLSKSTILNLKEVYQNIKFTRILRKKEKENSENLRAEYKNVSNILLDILKNNSLTKKKAESRLLKSLREELKLSGYIVYEDELINEENNYTYTFITDILTNLEIQKREITDKVSNVLEKKMTVKLLLNISKSEKSKIKLVSKNKYTVDFEVKKIAKDNLEISGDSYMCKELVNGKYISAISDGAGSGKEANMSSKNLLESLNKLLEKGFNNKEAINILEKILNIKTKEENIATLDLIVYDLNELSAEFIKYGSAPTYIIRSGKISTINEINLPVGIDIKSTYMPINKKLYEDDIIVQLSDGIVSMEENIINNKFTETLKAIDFTKEVKEILEEILEKYNVENDDATLIVIKIKKTN